MSVLKSIVGLFLGLVIQAAQIQPALAAFSTPCAPVAAAVDDCCKDKSSCPCLDHGGKSEAPAPAIPAPVEFKLNAPKLLELDFCSLFFIPEDIEATPTPASFPEFRAGFSGVPLSVAFCTFVI